MAARSRSSGGATATWRSPCAPTSRDGVQAPDVTNAIWPRSPVFATGSPPGYRIEIGGAIEESDKGNGSIFALFPLMLIAMLAC